MTEKKIGYAQASTISATQDRRERLKAAGCDVVFSDEPGKLPPRRQGLKRALAAGRPGDTFVTCTVDEISLNKGEAGRTTDKILQKTMELQILDHPAAAMTLIQSVNYAADPRPDTPFRYALFALGKQMIRLSR